MALFTITVNDMFRNFCFSVPTNIDSSCHDKTTQTGWLKQKLIFLQLWSLENQDGDTSKIRFS